jgi:PAS domain-containing protein
MKHLGEDGSKGRIQSSSQPCSVLRLIAEAAGFYTHFADTLLLWAGFAATKVTAPCQALTVSTHSAEGTYGLMGDEHMPLPSQYDADGLDGENGVGAPEKQLSIEAQLRATANVIPGHVWYATPAGVLVFVNSRSADYLGLPKDHPLRLGIDLGGEWDSHIRFLHPDDHEETRRVWSNCLRTGSAGEVAFRVRNIEGKYHWFLSRAEPLRASARTTSHLQKLCCAVPPSISRRAPRPESSRRAFHPYRRPPLCISR